MTAPISKLQARPEDPSSSQVIVRSATADAMLRATDERVPRAQSKLPTFVQGRVLARRFFVDEVFEFTPQSTFLRAHDLELERVVLIRLLPRAEPPELTREGASGWFRRVEHPLSSAGILGTLGVGVLSGGWPLLVCQYWRGRSLEALLRSGEPPKLLLILQVARQIAVAMAEAHRLGHVHGDLRSDDVWLSRPADGSERAMILGFQRRESTETHAALVTRDVSAFGDLLRLMIASLLPRSAAHRAAFDDHAPGNGLVVVIVAPLSRVAARCQQGSTGRGYRTAAEVATALEQVEAIAIKLSPHQ